MYAPLSSYLNSYFSPAFNQSVGHASSSSPTAPQNAPITKVARSILVDIVTRYLKINESLPLVCSCREFSPLWLFLCKLQSPFDWNHDPFHLKIQSIQDKAIQALAYTRLYGLRVQRRDMQSRRTAYIDLRHSDLWKWETRLITHVPKSPVFLIALSNGNIAIAHDHDHVDTMIITIWSSKGVKIATLTELTENVIYTKKLHQLPNGGIIETIQESKDSIKHLIALPNGALSAAVVNNGNWTISLWSDTGTLIAMIDHPLSVCCMAALSHGGIITGSPHGSVYLWSAAGNLLKICTGHTDSITGIEVLSGGGFATASKDNKVIVWSSVGTQVEVLQHDDEIRCMVVSQEGSIIAGSNPRTVTIWPNNGSYNDQKIQLQLPSHDAFYEHSIEKITVLPNKNILVECQCSHQYLLSPTGCLISPESLYSCTESAAILPYGVVLFKTNSMSVLSLAGKVVANFKRDFLVYTMKSQRGYIDRAENIAVLPNGDIVTVEYDLLLIWTVNIEHLTQTRSSYLQQWQTGSKLHLFNILRRNFM